MESFGAAFTKNMLNLKKVLKNLEAREFFANCKILSEFLIFKIIIWDDYA